MPYRVVVPKPVSRVIGAFGLGRTGLLIVLDHLHQELAYRADEYRADRIPEDPDLFRFPVLFYDPADDTWHDCRFAINDTMTPDTLIVMTVAHRTYPG